MGIYRGFADFYARGEYPKFSRRMAELLPQVLKKFDRRPARLLDMACGEGTFAVAMAASGLDVTAVDRSEQMLALARARADREGARVAFVRGDIRSMDFTSEFDLVTCWYDSLNYLVEAQDLRAAFTGARLALRPGGLFIFDMNTVYGLAVVWRQHGCYVQQDTPDLFEIHRASYDFESRIASLKITGFRLSGDAFVRVDETHRERAYSLEEIASCLRDSGLLQIACWGNLQEMSDPGPESPRVWIVAERP